MYRNFVLAAAVTLFSAGTVMGQSGGPPPPLPAEILAEEVEPAKVDYLRAHAVAGGDVDGPFSFSFPPAFYDSRLFLVGESHGSAATHRFDIALLEHLTRRAGVRDYLAEIDPVQADAFNVFLATGDDAGLMRVFDGWTEGGAQWGSRSYESKVRAIRDLNRTLGPDHPITFHGLDRVQDWPMTLDWLDANGIAIDRAAFDGIEDDTARASLVLASLPSDERGGSGTLSALRAVLTAMAGGKTREQTIFASYDALARGPLHDRAGYGMWGVFHTIGASVNGVMPFAAQVRASTLSTAAKVTSIVLLPIDSMALVYVPTADGLTPMRLDLFNMVGPIIKLDGSADLASAAAPGRITVYDLDLPSSPYRTSVDLIAAKTSIGQDITPTDPTLPATSYARYVGVVRGSDWAEARTPKSAR